MSGKLQIHFAHDMPAATVEVISPDLDTVGRVSLRPGESKDVEVPSEGSFLRVHLASGRTVTLKDSGNLNRTISMSSIEERGRSSSERSRSLEFGEKVRATPQRPLADGSPGWRLDDFEVQLVSQKRQVQAISNPISREIEFQPSESEDAYELRLRSKDVWAEVRLPGTLQTLTVAADEIESRRRVVVRASTSSTSADTISAYLARGDIYSAEAMADWADQADTLLYQKMRDPFAAAVGAYLLLRVRRLNRLNWAKNLADWFPRLSDGAIIYAWQCAHQRINENDIREYLTKALTAPLPVFTEGLKLLRDGAHLLEKPKDALQSLNSAHGVPVWTSPFTTTRRGFTKDGASVEFDIGY